jgi:hypothetical protein
VHGVLIQTISGSENGLGFVARLHQAVREPKGRLWFQTMLEASIHIRGLLF